MLRSYTFVADLSQTRAPASPSVTACAARPALPPAVRRLCRSRRHSSALPARARCRGSPPPFAPVAGLRPPGRSRAAASARAAGSRSPPPAPPSSTTSASGRRSPPGRSEDSVAWLRAPPASSPRSSGAPTGALLVTFVPPDGDRSLKRGHHPPAGLARELGRRWDLPVQPLLERTRPLRPQRGLSRRERQRNVRDAFRARSTRGKVLLVDDVYTTGATVSAAASALRGAGASSVEVVTFARAVRR